MEKEPEEIKKSIELECISREYKEKKRRLHYNWSIAVLILIIITILSYKFWGKSGTLETLISTGSGLVSIALAVIAIIMTLVEGLKKNNQEERVTSALKEIIKNSKKMSKILVKLDDSVGAVHLKMDTAIEYLGKESVLVNGYDEHLVSKKEGQENGETSNKTKTHESSSFPLKAGTFRGNVYLADMSPVSGSEMGGIRAVVIVSNDINNRYSPVMTVIPITSQIAKSKLPTHVEVGTSHGFDRESVVLSEQIRTIDRNRLTKLITTLDDITMKKIDHAIRIQLDQIDF
ncbi:hypothetical protein GCM10008018_36680 [Paenibacillus marchantiophytorum]|uniref:Type II toxin-antitoxin system PemK/MazF family toxin n=1 Tax=Paenibacillus marchantiophytorum TaxID=1619310 RepID=A0ABQ1EUX5_9BACL|nr:hypothetical protein GCM10008018_36680 [Paenibacillus marchantiophytorum]